MNNGCNEDNNYCYCHPREVVVGVCPLCLNERLLILASTQGRRRSSSRYKSTTTTTTYKAHQNDNNIHVNNKKPPINFHKIFDFGSLLHRLEFRPWKPDNFSDDDHDVSASQEGASREKQYFKAPKGSR